AILGEHAAKVDGVKISLLSKEKEIAMRRRLPAGMRMYTGDDFNYAELIAGDDQGYSDALLGIFDAIAPAASAGLAKLAAGDLQGFHGILEPTVPLSHHIFKAPTRFYKTGVVFLAWLNGLQDHFVMVGGQESARSLLHLAELFRLADKARVLHDPELAAARITKLLAVQGRVNRDGGPRAQPAIKALLDARISRTRAKQLLIDLVRVPSPQTALLEDEPLLKQFISTAIEPRLRAMGI